MAIEHVLTGADSLQTLALAYLGDAKRAGEIADYNKLDYPYIVESTDDLYEFYATGYVTVVLANYQNPNILKAGWTFQTKPNAFLGGVIKVFTVLEDTYIPAGMPVWRIPVRCMVPGTYGNVMAGMISEAGADTTSQSGIQFLQVGNEEPLMGGRDVNVKVVGESIYIPSEGEKEPTQDLANMLDAIGGEDLVLDSEGNVFGDAFGDVASVSGLANIEQALIHRLNTEKGEYPLHPEYGTDVPGLIGTARTPYTDKHVELEILQALYSEDRIENPKVNNLVVDGTAVYVDVSYSLAGSSSEKRLTTTIQRGV